VTAAATARPQLGATAAPSVKPIIKQPTWTWEIPCYFYTGGLAGASATLAVLAGARGNGELERAAWKAALAGTAISPVFLISDLGRPGRFLNMLRMVKVTSPMSIGSWVLSGFGAATSVGGLDAFTRGKVPLLRRAGRVARPAAGLLGLPLASYTGALIADTAIPVWHESRRWLPLVFVAGAAASAGGAAVALTDPEHAAPARRLALAGAVAEVALKETMQKTLPSPLEESYEQGAPHRFSLAARVALVAGAGVLLGGGRRSRAAAVLGGAAINAGALAARWSIFKAGFASAARPQDTVATQRR
jgi:hypothetical protein